MDKSAGKAQIIFPAPGRGSEDQAGKHKKSQRL